MASGCFWAISPSDGNVSGSATATATQIPITTHGHRTTKSASRCISLSCDASPVPAGGDPHAHGLHRLHVTGDRFLGDGIVGMHDRHDRALAVPKYVDGQLI